MTEQYKEADISRETVSVLLDALRDRNLLPDALVGNTEHNMKWSAFCDLLEIAESELGKNAIKKLTAEALKTPKLKRR